MLLSEDLLYLTNSVDPDEMQYYRSKSKGGGVIHITLSNDLDPAQA